MEHIRESIQSILDKKVQSSKMIPGAIVSARSGDRSFSWTGVCGSAELHAYRELTADTPFFIASGTKMITTAALLQFIDRGILNFQDRICGLLPDNIVKLLHKHCGEKNAEAITIEHLVTQRSGIADYYDNVSGNGLNFLEMAIEEPDKKWTPLETILYALTEFSPVADPGKKCTYSDTNYQLLGLILERTGGKTLEDIFHTNIFEPVHMDHSWLYTRSAPLKLTPKTAYPYCGESVLSSMKAFHSAWADGGVISTADDCQKFLRAFYHGSIFKKKHFKKIFKWRRLFPFVHYGMGTMRLNILFPLRMIFGFPELTGHIGSTGSFMLKTTGYDLYLAGSFNQTGFSKKQIHAIAQIASKIIKSGLIKKDI